MLFGTDSSVGVCHGSPAGALTGHKVPFELAAAVLAPARQGTADVAVGRNRDRLDLAAHHGRRRDDKIASQFQLAFQLAYHVQVAAA